MNLLNPAALVFSAVFLLSLPAPVLATTVPAAQTAVAASVDSAVAEAEVLVKRGDFAAAAQAYQRAIDVGGVCASLYYNHGTAALKSDQLGPAVLSLERGLRLSPGDPDLRYNHQRALEQITGPLAPAALLPRPQAKLLRLPLRHWQSLALSAWALALGLLIWRLLRLVLGRRPSARWTLVWPLAVALLAVVLSLVAWQRAEIEHRGDAVMIASTPQPAHEADSAEAPVAFTVQPGMPLHIVQRQGAWLRVELLNGLQAWLPSATVSEI